MKILNKDQCQKLVDSAVKRLADYLKENNLKGITTGISGGIDSSVVGLIGLRTISYLKKSNYNANYKYIFLDCESNPVDYNKAKEFSNFFGFMLMNYDLSQWYKQSPVLDLIPENHPKNKVAKGNIKARLRMIYLYNTALLNNYIYLDTDDLSEEWMGFWTRHGDEGDVKIIQQVTKTELYDVGEFLHVPQAILQSKPGDGLNVTENNLAEEQLGLDYIYVEYIVSRFIKESFNVNGKPNQLKLDKYTGLCEIVAKEISKPVNSVKKIVEQTLKTSYKRKHGDYAVNLLHDRSEFGFPEVGSEEFNKNYLKAVKISNHEKNEVVEK